MFLCWYSEHMNLYRKYKEKVTHEMIQNFHSSLDQVE